MANLTSPAKARHCRGENPQVWEITGPDQATLLRKSAEVIEEEGLFVNALNLHIDETGEVYLVLVGS